MPKQVTFVQDRKGMDRLKKGKGGTVDRYITRVTKDTDVYAHGFVPKPGGPPHGRSHINYSTGELSGSIISRVRTVKGEREGHVIAIPEHAIFVNEGTKPHVILPKRATVLSFFWARKGIHAFFKKVNHPGTKPNPFLWKALKKATKRL